MNFNPWQDYIKSSNIFFKDWNMNNNRSILEIEQQQNDSIVLQLNQILSIITEDSMYFLNLKKELSELNIGSIKDGKGENELTPDSVHFLNFKKELSELKIGSTKDGKEETEDSLHFLSFKKELSGKIGSAKDRKEKNEISFPETESYDSFQKQNILGTESPIEDDGSLLSIECDNEEKEEKKEKLILPCSFCRKNGERKLFYMSHSLKNSEGLVMCPVLQKYVCPKCKATGPKAHTLLYCPQKHNQYQSPSLTHSTPRMSSGKKRHVHH